MIPDTEWTRALRKGVEGAHDNMRYCLRQRIQQPRHAAYWRFEACRHHERAIWYLDRLRDARITPPISELVAVEIAA